MPLDVSDLKCDEELYRLLIDNSLQGLLILQDERIILVNKAVSEVIGYTPEELQSFSLKDLMAIVHPEDQERTFRGIENLIAGNLPPVRQEFRIIRKDGAISWVDTLASWIEYQDRPALHLAYLDITEQKRTEAVLRESEERYQAFIANSSEGIYRLESAQSMPVTLPEDDQIKFILEHAYIAECNDAFAQFYGLNKAEELIGKRMADFLISDPRNIEAIRAFVRSGYRLVDVESYEIDKKRNIHIISSSLTGIVENGFLVRAWGVQKDITERKRAEETLRESEEKYHTAIDFTYDCETWLSPEGNYVYVSPSCERLTGYSTDEFLKDPDLFEKIVHPDDREIYPRHFHNKDDIVGPIDFRIIARNGEERWISHICQPVFSSDGRYMGRRASNRDITDRKLAIEQTESLSKFPDENPNPILRIATDGTIIYANRGSAPLLELWGCQVGQRLPEEYGNLILDVLRSGNGREIEILSGGMTYSLVLVPITEMGYVNIYGRDITKRKRAEEALQEANEELEVTAEELRQQNDELMSAQSALKESEEKYRTIVETANEGIWAVDPEMQTTYVNRRMAEMLGYSPEEMIGKKSSEFMDEEGKARLGLLLERRRQGINESFEFKFIRKDGLPLWAISSAAPLRDKEGKFGGSLGMLTDITDRKRAENALQESEQRYSTTLASIGDAVIATDIEGRITFMNAVAEGLTGWTLDETSMVPAKAVFNIINEYTRQKVDDPITKVLENGSIVGLANHTILVRKDGMEVAIDNSGAPIKDRDGNTTGVVLIFRDITERKQMEMELLKARDELELKVQERTAELQDALGAAEESVKAKTAFLANMSHELRTPMNAVIGFSSLLLDDNLTQDQREYIEGIRKGGEALLAIIDDILEFSRSEKDKIELERQPFSLKHLIDESLDMVATQASKKGLNLSETINYGTPDTIIGDHGRIRQILVNLLGNAVKFTDKGDVSVSVSSKPVKGDERQIFFEVKDTGIGIPEDRMNEIFEPFAQVERTLSRKRDGVGLGLAITKNLVELMGGTIWIDSILGQGTTFHFMIPAETIPGKQLDFGKIDRGVTSESFPKLKPLRILVAEDNPSNQRVLVEMLKRLGYRPDAVADGREVIQALERQDYDMVLMDIKMPEMDGITAAKVIRKLRPENGPKIVAITAFALEGDREKCLEAGMDDYIAKPVQMRELAEVLKKYQLSQVG